MTKATYSMTAEDMSHLRHEICVANDTVTAVSSLIAHQKASAEIRSLLEQTTKKLDDILEYIDKRRGDADE